MPLKGRVVVRLLVVCGFIAALGAIPVAYDRGKDKEEKTWRRKLADLQKQSFQQKEIMPPHRGTARRQLVRLLAEARAAGDHREIAVLNGLLSQEALERAHATITAWSAFVDPETGLLPRDLSEDGGIWRSRDNASDMFPFFLMAGKLLNPAFGEKMLTAMATERRMCGPMPCTMTLRPVEVVKDSETVRLFGASEYAKDGLLSLTERFGPGPWMDRLVEVVDALLEAAPIQTPRGPIVASTAEVNGNMLQVLPRLAWATGNAKYVEMATRTAEVYLLDIIPKNNGLPANDWDFTADKNLSEYFQFRDHGNEIIPGLSEFYYYMKAKDPAKAAQYREPLKKLLDLMLTVGRTPDGIWYDRVLVADHQPPDHRVADNWGYLLNAYATFDEAEGTDTYRKEIERGMNAAASRRSFEWEYGHHDGYADSLESMIYQFRRYDQPGAAAWTDDEMEVMFDMQTSGGLTSATYLDGNFIRTALLYADWKRQGVAADPWTTAVSIGASFKAADKELVVSVDAPRDWAGRVRFDGPRHRTTWKLPEDYPRLNSWPEWFVVEAEKPYVVTGLDDGTSRTVTGAELQAGISVPQPTEEPYLFAVRAQ